MTTNHDGHNVIKKGKTSAAVQRYYCKDCGEYLPTGTQHGGDRFVERRASGNLPKTSTERWRKWNEKKKRQQQEGNDKK